MMSKPLKLTGKPARVLSTDQLERLTEKKVRTLHLDYETFCELDLRKVGLDVYTAHPSCRVLMCAYRLDEGELQQWFPHLGPTPKELRRALKDPKVTKWAFNAQFERVITRRVLKIKTRIKGWRCSMALAYMHCFAGQLEQVGAQIGLPADKQKLSTGKRLIKIFCMPNKVTKNQPHEIRDWDTDPEDWEQFCEYNRQDVIAEEGVMQRLRRSRCEIPDFEWDLYELDQLINDRGIPIDMQFVENIIWMSAKRKRQLLARMAKLTGCENPNSQPQLLPWLKRHGYPASDLRADTVKKVLKKHEKGDIRLTSLLVKVLKLRQVASLTSVNKAKTAKLVVGAGDCIRYMLQFGGASRTLRWAGRKVQTQNMKRTPKLLEAEEDDTKLRIVTDLIRAGDMDGLELMVGEPMIALSGCMRSMFRCPNGEEFQTADLKSIESAVIAWVTKCKRLLKVFREGRDPYKDFGKDYYKKPEEEITRAERNDVKPPALGCFAGDTLVLTLDGWKPINEIRESDLVFDGLEFVRHSGIIDQGVKPTIGLYGVRVTPDHRILCGENWWEAEDVYRDIRLGRKATNLAIGGLLSLSEKRKGLSTIVVSVEAAGKYTTGQRRALSWANRNAAYLAPMRGYENRKMEFILGSQFQGELSTDLRTDIMPSCLGAEEKGNRDTDTKGEALNAGLPMSTISLDTASNCREQKMQIFGSIGSIMTDTTRKGTSDLQTIEQADAIRKICDGSNTRERLCALLSSGNGLRQSIEISQPSLERSERGYQPNRLSQAKRGAGVRTYDILNCGSQNRFMVLTGAGPMIVHNCGFRMGPGKELEDGKKTGLIGYAENMGVDMSVEHATRAVGVYRSIYIEIPKHWFAYEKAIRSVMRDGKPVIVGYVTFERLSRSYLTIKLPSGRRIYYFKPRVDPKIIWNGKWKKKIVDGVVKRMKDTYTRLTFTHMGRDNTPTGRNIWRRIESHGGVIIENIVQAIARDVLCVGMWRAHEAGFHIVGHAHDEVIARQRRGDNKMSWKYLCNILSEKIDWAPGLPLGAAGWGGAFYRKA